MILDGAFSAMPQFSGQRNKILQISWHSQKQKKQNKSKKKKKKNFIAVKGSIF